MLLYLTHTQNMVASHLLPLNLSLPSKRGTSLFFQSAIFLEMGEKITTVCLGRLFGDSCKKLLAVNPCIRTVFSGCPPAISALLFKPEQDVTDIHCLPHSYHPPHNGRGSGPSPFLTPLLCACCHARMDLPFLLHHPAKRTLAPLSINHSVSLYIVSLTDLLVVPQHREHSSHI